MSLNSEDGSNSSQVLRLKVTGIMPGGQGFARKGGQIYEVYWAVPGDVVEVKVVSKGNRRTKAVVLRRVSETTIRVAPKCEHFEVCGGCQWQNIAYEDQLKIKHEMVSSCFKRSGLDRVNVAEVLGSEEIFNYRNKMDFSFGRSKSGELTLGLFQDTANFDPDAVAEKAMPAVFNVEKCWLQSDMSNKIVRQVRDQLMDTGLIPYDPATRSGTLRSLVVREASDTGDTLVSLGVARKIHPEGVAEAVSRASDSVKGFVMSVNRKRSKNAVPKSQEVVTGGGTIVEKVLGLEIAWSVSSFAQVNTDQAQRLYSLALDEACLTGSEKVLDLYCGAGTLSLLLARNAARVTGVELLEKSVEDAQENALRNGITNCSFVCDDVLASVGDQVDDVDVVTINPPRAGMDRAVVDKICRMKASRIVYISCNALTLVRDLVIFKRRGFKIGRAQPVDLFPHTHHCEVIVGLSRNER